MSGSVASSSIIGIIYPPPELRTIVDKAAQYVAKNGVEFEKRIREKEAGNTKFSFLNDGDPYNAYYRNKISEFDQGTAQAGEPKPPSEQTNSEENKAAIPDSNEAGNSSSIDDDAGVKNNGLKVRKIVLKDPPAEWKFILDIPSISASDVDIVKLTALFVAKHGKQFLANLMTREGRNYQFDFLRPQHSLFNYFTRMVEHYTQIIHPTRAMLDKLKEDVSHPQRVLDRVYYRMEWNKKDVADRKKKEEEEDAEKLAYSLIDWHDFVVVETIDFPADDDSELPPPARPEELGLRVLAQQRLEELGQEQHEDVEMDIEEEDQQNSSMDATSAASTAVTAGESSAATATTSAAQQPQQPQQPIKVRRDYDPKQAAKERAESYQEYQVCPRCNERVALRDFAEHLRIELLDPRWKQQKDKMEQEKRQLELVFASGTDISSYLSSLAQKRSDIFGTDETATEEKEPEDDLAIISGRTEAALARERQRESMDQQRYQQQQHQQQHQQQPVVWDGYTSSAAAAQRAAMNQAMQNRAQFEEQERERQRKAIGPSTPHHVQQSVPQPPGPPLISFPPIPGFSAPGLFPPPILLNPAPVIESSKIMGHDEGDMIHGRRDREDDEGQSNTKRSRFEEQLIPEHEFASRHPGPITISVQVPVIFDSKLGWNCQGQTLQLTLDSVAANVTQIKQMIQNETAMPSSKQKLQLGVGGPFLKDLTAAYYNLDENSTLILSVKERGGKK